MQTPQPAIPQTDARRRIASHQCDARCHESALLRRVSLSPIPDDRYDAGSEPVGSGDVGSSTENTELVPLRIGQYYPTLLALADVDPSRTQSLESSDLVVAVATDGADVEVHSVLHLLGLGNGNEHDDQAWKRRAGL